MKKIQVLMSTYNGEKYLKEQIDSILNQEDVEVSLLIRDDGSKDQTIKIIEEYVKQYNNVEFYQGENLGSAKSFMDLVMNSDEVNYYAFSDQDDVWDKNKLKVAIEKLEKTENIPAQYISATKVVDEELNILEIKKVSGNFTFEGEMIQNFAVGCTQVLNKELRDIIKLYNPEYIIMHDSWITRVCYAIGGTVIIDENAYIKYRQHNDNVVGYKPNKFKKLKKQFNIAFKENVSMRGNIASELIKGYENILTENAKQITQDLISYRDNKTAKKNLLKNKKFKSNSKVLNIKLRLAIKLNKF